jgi:hypothetical protein
LSITMLNSLQRGSNTQARHLGKSHKIINAKRHTR